MDCQLCFPHGEIFGILQGKDYTPGLAVCSVGLHIGLKPQVSVTYLDGKRLKSEQWCFNDALWGLIQQFSIYLPNATY